MGCIRDIPHVRTRTDATDAMFEPLRNVVTLLKKWNVPVQEETLTGLEEAPNLWAEVKKQNYNTLESLNPLQNAQATKIKMEQEAFSVQVTDFRTNMKENAPYECSDKEQRAFDSLEKFNE